MKLHWQCISPDCEAPRQGTTDYCASCNSAKRKESRLMSKEPKKVKKPRFATPKRAKQLEQYSVLRKQYLAIHQICEVATCNAPATDIHHQKSRDGDMLLDTNYWMAVCRPCHERITKESKWAIQKGYSFSRLETQNE